MQLMTRTQSSSLFFTAGAARIWGKTLCSVLYTQTTSWPYDARTNDQLAKQDTQMPSLPGGWAGFSKVAAAYTSGNLL